MRIFLSFYLLCAFVPIQGNSEYQFIGRHLVAEYYGCDKKAILSDKKLEKAMLQASRASGATVLRSVGYHFTPNGYSLVILLSESHASIHTYPEKRACFVDLFTCGTHCDSKKFEKVLQEYLRPEKTHSQVIDRK
jgi:S-adenosylmethionine decarboxylase proenzyme